MSAKEGGPEAENRAVIGTIENKSNVCVGGYTPQLLWGKWVHSPRFPITQTKFHASGVS